MDHAIKIVLLWFWKFRCGKKNVLAYDARIPCLDVLLLSFGITRCERVTIVRPGQKTLTQRRFEGVVPLSFVSQPIINQNGATL